MMPENINKQIFITFVILLSIIVFFQFTNVDIIVQEYFFNFKTNLWIWDRDEPISKLFLYSGMKKVLIVFAIFVLIILVTFYKSSLVKKYKKGMIIIVLSAIVIPFITISLKTISNTPCPKNIEHFGGDYPDIKVFDAYPKGFVQKEKIRCWPAGHASGGFALMSLFFLFKKRKNRITALVFAVTLGWIIGTYKMIIGDHFLSHTIITMVLSWLLILIIVKIVNNFKRTEFEKSTKI